MNVMPNKTRNSKQCGGSYMTCDKRTETAEKHKHHNFIALRYYCTGGTWNNAFCTVCYSHSVRQVFGSRRQGVRASRRHGVAAMRTYCTGVGVVDALQIHIDSQARHHTPAYLLAPHLPRYCNSQVQGCASMCVRHPQPHTSTCSVGLQSVVEGAPKHNTNVRPCNGLARLQTR
jgi:hypothetical protein